MFARMSRKPGTPAYEVYYASRPELQKSDDRLRNMPPLMRPGGRHYHPDISAEAESWFKKIDGIEPDRATVEKWSGKIRRSVNRTVMLKEMALSLGAVAAGGTAVVEEYVYTHRGRFDDDYGQEIRLDHPSAIVFLVEMDFDAMRRAPQAEALRESARQYYRAAVISRTLAAALRACGHGAREHYDAHYDLILPPLAVSAGLGELGRNNILIAERYGSRVRIGAVSTDMPVEHDAPLSLGADHFCSICKKCAENCPSRALSTSNKEEVLGVLKWPTDVQRCYGYWRALGTDCGICMACCPFSHRDGWLHNIVRWFVRRGLWTHRMALFFDDLIYGRRWSAR
jgi:reductive dehalogenase